MEILWTVVGTAGAVLTSFGFVPQVRKIWRRRSVGDVSAGTLFQFATGATLWTVYGLGRGDAVIIGANIITFITVFAGLVLFYRYREKKAKGIIHSNILAAQDSGVDPTITAHENARGLVKIALHDGADIGEIARAAVREAADSAEAPDVRIGEKEIVRAVASGLEQGAAEAGDNAVREIRRSVSDILSAMEAEED
jgi:MtN3 and saliva related transmembrane protein